MAKATTKNVPAEQPVEDGKSDFVITALAPPRVGGRRVVEGQTEIRLTEEEARAELLAGHIRPKGLPPRKVRQPAEEPTDETASTAE